MRFRNRFTNRQPEAGRIFRLSRTVIRLEHMTQILWSNAFALISHFNHHTRHLRRKIVLKCFIRVKLAKIRGVAPDHHAPPLGLRLLGIAHHVADDSTDLRRINRHRRQPRLHLLVILDAIDPRMMLEKDLQ